MGDLKGIKVSMHLLLNYSLSLPLIRNLRMFSPKQFHCKSRHRYNKGKLICYELTSLFLLNFIYKEDFILKSAKIQHTHTHLLIRK